MRLSVPRKRPNWNFDNFSIVLVCENTALHVVNVQGLAVRPPGGQLWHTGMKPTKDVG